MSRPFARTLIVLVALAHATFFIVYQSPDWPTQWTDQAGYTRLGEALAKTGHFTRYPFYPRYIPEVLRTPGYPAFVAAVNLTIGQGQLPVATAQAVVFAAICLIVYAMARLVASDRVAFGAGMATALFPPLPYFGALTLTEVFITFLVTAGVYLWLRALRDGGRWTVAAGAVLAAAALTRPSFQYLGVALGAFALFVAPRSGAALRRTLLLLVVIAVGVAPWVVYNFVYFRLIALSPPAAGVGRTLWEGSWQVALPGREQSALTQLAGTIWDRVELDRAVAAYARQTGVDRDTMLRYVHQWQDVRRMWDTPTDPWERAVARVAADHEYGRLARENIARDPVRHVFRRLTRGVALLWITEIPVRYTDINRLPPTAIRAMWLAQTALLGAALAGLVVVWTRGGRAEAAALAAVIVYVTAVHAVLYSEARYAMPAKPVVLLLAAVAAARVFEGRRSFSERVDRLPPSQSQTEV
jgi:4-amino-4-deoxy-L-arabinose transferase-like glycosyltransferase